MTRPARFTAFPVASVAALHAATPARIPFVQQLRLYLGADAPHAARPYCIVVAHAQEALCWLDGSSNRLVFAAPAQRSSDRLQRLMRQPGAPLSLHPLQRVEFEHHAVAGRVLSIGPALWALGLAASTDGTPLPSLDVDTQLKLRRWPDFRVLGHRHDDFRICAVLIKHGLDAGTCCTLLGLPHRHVQSFFNAAFLSGYAFPTRDTPPALRTGSPSRLAGLWRQIRDHWSS